MSKRVKKHLPLLKMLCHANHNVAKAVMKTAPQDVLKAVCECAVNVLKGNVPLTSGQKNALRKHKKGLRELVQKKTTQKRRKQIIQKGGFLGALLKPVLGVLGGLLSGSL